MERRFYFSLKQKLRLGSADGQLLKTAPKERTSQKPTQLTPTDFESVSTN